MPEFLRNLTVAEFLWRLGILIWLGAFRLDFNNEIYNNNREQPLTMKADCNQKIGSRKRAFSGASIFSQISLFRLRDVLR